MANVNVKTVLKITGFVLTGAAAVAQAISKDKDAQTLNDLVQRVSELENGEA